MILWHAWLRLFTQSIRNTGNHAQGVVRPFVLVGREDKRQEVEGKEEKEVDYGLLQGHIVHIPFFLANRLGSLTILFRLIFFFDK